MSEDRTKELPDTRSFEERILSAIAEMRADFNARLTALEETANSRAYETKPIWERALAETQGIRHDLKQMDVRLDRIESMTNATRSEMLALRADFKESRAQEPV